MGAGAQGERERRPEPAIPATSAPWVRIVYVGDVPPGQRVGAELMLRAKASGVSAVAAQVQSTEQEMPIAAQSAVEIVVEDEYYVLQNASRPGSCGLPGLFPLFTLVGLLGLRRCGWGGM